MSLSCDWVTEWEEILFSYKANQQHMSIVKFGFGFQCKSNTRPGMWNLIEADYKQTCSACNGVYNVIVNMGMMWNFEILANI
jgi:hypothetical protein